MTKPQKAQAALEYYANFYHIPIRSDDTVLGIAICRHCGLRLSMVDVAGRRNYFGLVSHTSKHLGEHLRAEEGRTRNAEAKAHE